MKTWGDLRTLNTNIFASEMIEQGKNTALRFKLNKNSSSNFIIISQETWEMYREFKRAKEVAENKLAAIEGVLGIIK